MCGTGGVLNGVRCNLRPWVLQPAIPQNPSATAVAAQNGASGDSSAGDMPPSGEPRDPAALTHVLSREMQIVLAKVVWPAPTLSHLFPGFICRLHPLFFFAT